MSDGLPMADEAQETTGADGKPGSWARQRSQEEYDHARGRLVHVDFNPSKIYQETAGARTLRAGHSLRLVLTSLQTTTYNSRLPRPSVAAEGYQTSLRRKVPSGCRGPAEESL